MKSVSAVCFCKLLQLALFAPPTTVWAFRQAHNNVETRSRRPWYHRHHHQWYRPVTTRVTQFSSTSALGASQVPLDQKKNHHHHNLSVDIIAEEDEREFLQSSNRELLRQAEEEHRLRYEQHRRLVSQQGRQQHDHDHDHDPYGDTALSLTDSLFQQSHHSFKNVESMSESLFTHQPLVALAIFVGLGCIVAYTCGLVFLDGYISSLNPALNGGVPYWDDKIPTDEDSILLIHSLHEIKEKLPSLWFWD